MLHFINIDTEKEEYTEVFKIDQASRATITHRVIFTGEISLLLFNNVN